MAPLVYLKKQLNFSMGEWSALSQDDKDWYKEAAIEEMNTLRLTIK